jgi:hypothetical protein
VAVEVEEVTEEEDRAVTVEDVRLGSLSPLLAASY